MSLKANKPDEEKPGVIISAKYEIVYTVEKMDEIKLTKTLLDLFYDRTAGMSVWTYFREYVNTSVSRMGLPPLTLPLRKR